METTNTHKTSVCDIHIISCPEEVTEKKVQILYPCKLLTLTEKPLPPKKSDKCHKLNIYESPFAV